MFACSPIGCYIQCALQALAAPVARTKRDNDWKEVPARELVPGDVIQLKGGDVIPADAKASLPDAQITSYLLMGCINCCIAWYQ